LQAIAENRVRNEFNEFAPGRVGTLTNCPSSRVDPACDPVVQIAQAVRVLVSQDLGDRDKRAVVKEIA
jgi:hypothetical protein